MTCTFPPNGTHRKEQVVPAQAPAAAAVAVLLQCRLPLLLPPLVLLLLLCWHILLVPLVEDPSTPGYHSVLLHALREPTLTLQG